MPASTLLKIDNITARMGEKVIFRDLSFEVNEGDCLLITGNSGSGKSALLEVIAGNFNVVAGHISRPFYDAFIAGNAPKDPYFNYRHLVSYLPVRYQFKNLSNTSDFFYQQRFNAAFSEDAPTVRDYLAVEEQNSLVKGVWTAATVSSLFRLESLQTKQLIKLSNGETKRLRMAASLLKNPKLLLLDCPLVGLDADTRARFHSILNEILASGMAILLTGSPTPVPAPVTGIVVMDHCKVAGIYPKNRFHQVALPTPKPVSVNHNDLKKLLAPIPDDFGVIVQMKNVSVRYGDTQILDGVSWEVKPGERWALKGPNGAGKSTLLSLINADNPQSYANDIVLFDRKRGSGESIWDIKKRIGFVSPELLQYFHSRASCFQVVCSGFHDTTGLLKPVTPEQERLADQWVQLFETEDAKHQTFETASPTIQRLILLARALVKNPPLLILDEPCQGLDQEQQLRVLTVVDAVCKVSATALIYVTHYEEELPSCVDNVISLEGGRRIQ